MALTTLSTDPSTSHISLSDAQSYVNDELRHFFEQATRRAVAIAPNYQRLWAALEQTSLAGGKRLRPYLTYIAYQAFGGESS